MKKILIVYATAGIGHKKASMAVKKAFDELNIPGVSVSMIDALDYTNDFFKWTYLKAYLLMVNKLPLFWGFSYYLTNNRFVNFFVSKIRRFSNRLNSGKLVRYILETKPDVVISTHFFASEVISDMKRNHELDTHLITVITDYRLHSWWVADYVDTYVVGGDGAKDDLLKLGIDPGNIKVLGIPAEPVFSKKLDKNKIYEKTGLKGGLLTILVIGGGFGVGPIGDIVHTMNNVNAEFQVITICGHNEKLVKELEELKPHLKFNMMVLGFVDNVYEYMEISDLLISKSGGITVTESLAKELPMVVISPIIGQETNNCDYVTGEGAAIKVDKLSELKDALEDLASHPDKICRMRQSISKIKKPNACYDIAKFAVELGGANE